jgi:hypothetical protein
MLSGGALSASNFYIGSTGSYSQTSGTFTVGTMQVGVSGGGSASALWSGGSLSVTDLQLDGSGVFTLAAGTGRVLKVSTISSAGTSKLDMKDNKAIVTSTPIGSWNGSNYDGVTGLIRSGRNAGGWDGSGIVTSMTDAASPGSLTALAVATAGDAGKSTFGGVSVVPSDVLVMYTYSGDANLSGKIDADDYFQIDSHYNKSANSAKSWFNGDFNYDGKINGDDYFLIDNAFAGQGAPFSSGGLPAGVSAVPEPVSALLAAAMSGGVLLSRRRR